MKVLIIDDNPAVRTTLRLVLNGVFDEIAAVGDPRLIPALLAAGNIDAGLREMNFDNSRLGGSDGRVWLSRIKESENAPAVVLITAFGDVPLAVEAMKLGAEDFVTKPWDNDELIAKLNKAIARNRAGRDASLVLDKARELERLDNQRRQMTLDELKFEHVSSVVDSCGGNLSAAADSLGITRQTLYNILKKK
ncbi:MAG: response regulator [Muribaculaceae bacterium]|nr:response regulator [Muribaculaceae bacterium]